MDFVVDQLHDGRKIRIWKVIDTFSRECLATTTGSRLRSEDVSKTLNQILVKRGAPKKICCDNGTEFARRITDLCAYTNKVTLAFSRPGKPTDNAFIESFNGSSRDECLNCYWFTSYEDAKVKSLGEMSTTALGLTGLSIIYLRWNTWLRRAQKQVQSLRLWTSRREPLIKWKSHRGHGLVFRGEVKSDEAATSMLEFRRVMEAYSSTYWATEFEGAKVREITEQLAVASPADMGFTTRRDANAFRSLYRNMYQHELKYDGVEDKRVAGVLPLLRYLRRTAARLSKSLVRAS